MNKGILVVVSAPSGCGKDTVVSEVLKRMPDKCFLSVSMTTRAMRKGETDGVDYFFVTKEEFRRHIDEGDMLEYAVYGDNMYGTPIGPVRDMLDNGKTVFLIIEVEGGGNVKKPSPMQQKYLSYRLQWLNSKEGSEAAVLTVKKLYSRGSKSPKAKFSEQKNMTSLSKTINLKMQLRML